MTGIVSERPAILTANSFSRLILITLKSGRNIAYSTVLISEDLQYTSIPLRTAYAISKVAIPQLVTHSLIFLIQTIYWRFRLETSNRTGSVIIIRGWPSWTVCTLWVMPNSHITLPVRLEVSSYTSSCNQIAAWQERYSNTKHLSSRGGWGRRIPSSSLLKMNNWKVRTSKINGTQS